MLWKRPSLQDGAACSRGEDLPSCLIYLFCGPRSCGCGGCRLSLAEKYLYDMPDNKMMSDVCKFEPKSRRKQPATAARCLGKLGVSRLGTAFLLCMASVCRAPSCILFSPLQPWKVSPSFPEKRALCLPLYSSSSSRCGRGNASLEMILSKKLQVNPVPCRGRGGRAARDGACPRCCDENGSLTEKLDVFS